MNIPGKIYLAIACWLFLLSCIQVLYRHRAPLNVCMAIAYFFLAGSFFYYHLVETGEIIGFFPLYYFDIVATAFCAVSLRFTLVTIMSEEPHPPEGFGYQYVWAASIAAILLAYNLGLIPIARGSAVDIAELRGTPANPFPRFLNVAANLVFTLYAASAALEGRRLCKKGEIANPSRCSLLVGFAFTFAILGVVFSAAALFPGLPLFRQANYLSGFLALAFFFYGVRNPEYTQRVIKSTSAVNRRRELLSKTDTRNLSDSLADLMRDERLYLDPNLSIEDVSRRLGVQATVISAYLNQRMQVNFRAFINGYRVQAVCEALIAAPERAILDVAIECGFSSKSTFNTVFQEITGKTPRQYRKDAKTA